MSSSLCQSHWRCAVDIFWYPYHDTSLHTAQNLISFFLVIAEPVFTAIQSNRKGKRVSGISLTLLSVKLRARQCRPELITKSNYTLCLGDIDDIFNFKFTHLQLFFRAPLLSYLHTTSHTHLLASQQVLSSQSPLS